MKTKLLFVKRRFLIVLLFALALTFACLIAGATTSVAYAAGEHTDHSGWNTLSGTLDYDDRDLPDGNYVLTDDLIFTESNVYYPKESTAENIVWCLNGHTLVNGSTGNITPTIQNSRNGKVITICDCTGKGRVDSLATYGVSFSNVSLYNINAGVQYNTVTTIDGNTKIYSGRVDAAYGNMIIGGNTYIETGVEFTVGNDGHLIINGGTVRCDIEVTGGTCDISGGTFYGAINVSGGTCNITGGTFSSPINVSGGTCNITGGTIKTSQYYNDDPGTPQGAVMVNGGVCNIGGTAQITGNRVDYGGAVCVNGGTCTISGNNITNNNVTYGAVYVVDGTCTIESDAVISGNKSFSNGGGVYVAGGECKISGTITNNEATAYGGGVYVAGGKCTITGTITNNKVQADGGGVYVAGGECTVAGGVQENTATKGGGVYIEGGKCTLSSSKCLIRKNTATYDGGGVYVAGGTCSIYSQAIIQENTATYDGGGVYVAYSQSVLIAGTIDSNIANQSGGGVYLRSNASLELNGSIVNNSTATGSNPGNGGGIYCGSGCSLTLNSSSVITGNKAYGQGGGIYLNGTAANPCTVTFNGYATVNSNTEYRNGGTVAFNNVYALNSKITFNSANALSSVQQNSIVLNTSSCTLADGKWETDQIRPYFELQDGGEIIIAGGYYSNDPAQLFTIADTARVVQIDENSGDDNYDAAYPWAVYPVRFEYMSGRQNGSLVYDGQPIEKDTDFTLSLEYSQVYVFYYWYKAVGADDSAYVLGLPADAGTYTVKVGAPYIWSSFKEYWECTFDVTIAKADPSYTVPTNVIARVGTPLSAVQLPDGWTWQDGSIVPDTEGTQTYKAIYTPSDTVNYNIIEADISVSVEHKHIGAKVEEVAATCTQNGVKAHYECSVCHELFEDSDCQTPIDDFDTWKIISPLGHDFVWTSNGDGTHTGVCQHDGCEETVTDNCSGGEATFFDYAICEVCGGEYGELIKYRATTDFDGQTYYYETFGEAVEAIGEFSTTAEKRAVLKLFDNIDMTSALTFNTGFITLYLNGYMLKQTGSGSVISINEGADFILDDLSSATTTHNYYVAEDGLWTFYDGDLPEAAPDGAVTGVVTGGVITGGNASDGGVYIDGGTFTMTGGTVAGNMATNGGGVYLNTGTFNMTGGAISGNVATRGGGVFVFGGTFTMEGGTISGNTAVYNNNGGNGGGVLVDGIESATGLFTMSGGTVSDNDATYYGSGLYLYTNGNAEIGGGYFGGSIYEDGTISVSGGYFAEEFDTASLAENCVLQDVSALGGATFDSDYKDGFPYAVYAKGGVSISTNENIVYDGSPVAEGVDFTVEGADGVTLPYSYKAEGGDEFTAGLPTNAGKYAVSACALNGEKQFISIVFDITIAKATPVYTTPTDLTICADHTLAGIALPSGWAWKDSSVAVGEAGEKTFAAVFTPEDTLNYNTVEGSVTVTVTAHTGGTATCTYKADCSVCGMKYGELTPHVFDQKVTTEKYLASEATCTQKATYYYSCVCGEKDTETFEYGELAPHVFDQKVATAEYLASEATCTQKATYYYSCVCGEKGTETFEHGELAEHTAVEIPAVEATCTQPGMTAGSKCSVCGEILVAPEEIAPLGHIDENGDELCDRCGFDMSIPEFTITVTGGTIEGAIGSTVIVEENGSVTVVASEAPEGKEFRGWSIDGGETIISAEAAYTFTASEDTVLTAVFADKQSDVKPGGEITPENPEGLSGGAIAGIVIGSTAGAACIGAAVWFFAARRKKSSL